MLDQLTLFAEDTPASRLVLPGSEGARKMTVTSGLKCADLFQNSGPLGSCVRMLLGTSAWASTMCFLTWEHSATPASRLLFRLSPSTPAIDETESGFLPTPTAGEANDYNTNWQSLANVDKGGRIMRRLASAMLPTPCAADHRDRGGPSNPAIQRRMNIGKSIELSMHWDGPLNPQFVEEMMGFPVGWTDPDLKPSETP